MNKILSIVLFMLSLSAAAQDKYWVAFKDKQDAAYHYSGYLSEETIRNRNIVGLPLHQYTDVPVNTTYINALETIGVQPLYPSRWLNAVSVYMTKAQAAQVEKLPFVTEVAPINRHITISSYGIAVNPAYVHIAMKQMQINSFIDDSLTGKGIVIGVVDAGFYDAQNDKMLKHIFEENKIIGQRDFLSPERQDLITQKATDADYHGRMVLDMIAGYNSITRELSGMAPNSRFYLARTEHGDKEFRGEEDTWIAAMEWMDSKGVRLISTSLGYAIKMDDPADDYKLEEMNGKTTRISKAAQIATDQKGIFLVVSAGNEGSNASWGIVSSPADAQGVLSVGATRSENCERIEYSSKGPEFLPYLKPNVSCYSPNGTSFSAPAIAGFVACMMQKAPSVNNKKMKEIIEKSGHLYPYGNNFIGYGIPRASRALKLLEDPNYNFGTASQKEVAKNTYVIRIKKGKKQEAVLFHKKNEFVVTEQETRSFKDGKLKVRKPSDAERTTVSYQDTVLEIIWKK